eukprot:Em0016g303a
MGTCGCGCLFAKNAKDGQPHPVVLFFEVNYSYCTEKLQYDADFRGPIRGRARRPKDILCLALFLIFICLYLAVGVYGECCLSSNLEHVGTKSLEHVGTKSLEHVGTKSLEHVGTKSLEHVGTKSLEHGGTKSLEHVGTKSLEHGGTKSLEHVGTKSLEHVGTKSLEHVGTKSLEHGGTKSLEHVGTKSLEHRFWIHVHSHPKESQQFSRHYGLLNPFAAWANGNPNRLLYPVDTKGRLCGVDDGVKAGVPHELISLYPKSLAVVAPASAADHNRVTCVPKPGRWSRLGYPGSLGKSAGQTGTRVTLVTNCVTCVPNQDAGPGLASRLCRDKPAGLRPALLNKPNLLFFDLMQCAKVIKLTDLISGNVDTSKLFTCPTPQVCVESCPTANELGLRENPVCVDGVDTAPFQNLTFLDIPQAYLGRGRGGGGDWGGPSAGAAARAGLGGIRRRGFGGGSGWAVGGRRPGGGRAWGAVGGSRSGGGRLGVGLARARAGLGWRRAWVGRRPARGSVAGRLGVARPLVAAGWGGGGLGVGPAGARGAVAGGLGVGRRPVAGLAVAVFRGAVAGGWLGVAPSPGRRALCGRLGVGRRPGRWRRACWVGSPGPRLGGVAPWGVPRPGPGSVRRLGVGRRPGQRCGAELGVGHYHGSTISPNDTKTEGLLVCIRITLLTKSGSGTLKVANRCIPTFVDLQDLINNTLNFNATGTPKNVSNYLTQVNLASILNGSVCLAGVVVWVGIISALLLIVFISGFCYYQFYCFENVQLTLPSAASGISLLSNVFNETVSVSQQICVTTSPLRQFIASTAPWFKYQKETWLALGIIGTVFLLVMVLILIFLGSKIRISVAIIKEASSFLLTSSTASFSVITNTSIASEFLNVTGLGVISNGMQCDPNSKTSAFSVAQTIFLPSNLSGNASVSCYFNSFVTSNFLLGLHVFHLFGLFWIGNFIVALGECTLAGAFASYYWAFKKPKDVPTFALIESFGRTVLFHSGSLAFGSLIIAIVQIARVILAYIQKKLKGKSGKVIKVLLCLLQCCFWLLEKVLRYVNRQAYIEIAIYGYDFCTGACKAIGLLLRNVITTAVKDRVVGLLLFMGKIFITAAVGVLAYLGFGPYVDGGSKLWGGKELNYFLIPVIALMVITYLIASSFMSVYHMAVDTIFICAMEDLERNNGFDKPYFMTKDLQNILGVKNKVQDRPDGTVEMQQTDGRDL